VHLEALWSRDAPDVVIVGQVFDAQGKALDLRRLIQRRWGWPKKAAVRATEALESWNGDGHGFRFPVRGPERVALQQELMEALPGLVEDLMEGMANRAQREASDAGRPLERLTVSVVDTEGPKAIEDGGFVNGVLHVLAGRLGITVDALRERTEFTGDDGHLIVEVFMDGIDD
jgi:hypothetical protein